MFEPIMSLTPEQKAELAVWLDKNKNNQRIQSLLMKGQNFRLSLIKMADCINKINEQGDKDKND